MSTYIIIPTRKTAEARYSAPSMIVEAASHEAALHIAKTSALGRFPEWSFHVAVYQHKRRVKMNKPPRKADSNSRSQRGKITTSNPLSRPQRRAARRLFGEAKGSRARTSMQCW